MQRAAHSALFGSNRLDSGSVTMQNAPDRAGEEAIKAKHCSFFVRNEKIGA
jgi:hypothetical protein